MPFVCSAAHHGFHRGLRVTALLRTLDIVLGWMPVALILSGVRLLGAIALLAGGGQVSPVGFVVFVLERPNPRSGAFGFHEIWHLLVMIAATSHSALMATDIPPWQVSPPGPRAARPPARRGSGPGG